MSLPPLDPGADDARGHRTPAGKSPLGMAAWFASETVDMNANAIANSPLAVFTGAILAAGVRGLAGGAESSAHLCLAAFVFHIALFATALVVRTISTLALHEDEDQQLPPASGSVSWAKQHQYILVWVAGSLFVLTQVTVSLRLIVAAHFTASSAATAYTSYVLDARSGIIDHVESDGRPP